MMKWDGYDDYGPWWAALLGWALLALVRVVDWVRGR